jgi:phosphopantothenoylcysteine synthetase/decarboxylase
MMSKAFKGKTIGVGVSGGISAYKTADLVSKLVQAGAEVEVVMTPAAVEFVRPLVFETLTGKKTRYEMFHFDPQRTPVHVSIAQCIDVLVIAPATANTMAKIRLGLADNVLSSLALSTTAPLLLAPAMNVQMWKNAATQDNVKALKVRGAAFVGPGKGNLACGVMGVGRMAEVAEIIEALESLL